MSSQLWTDGMICDAIKNVAHNDLPDMKTQSVTPFQAEQLMRRVRNAYEIEYRQREAELATLRARVEKLEGEKGELIAVLKLAYRKHHLEDDRIGWDELSDAILDALSNAIGVEELVRWQEDTDHE